MIIFGVFFCPRMRVCLLHRASARPGRDGFGLDWPGPEMDQKRSEIVVNGTQPLWVVVPGQDPLGQSVGSAFMLCFVRFSPVIGVCWPALTPFGPGKWTSKWTTLDKGYSLRLGPVCVSRSATKKLPYLRLDRRNHDSAGTFPPCRPPLLVVSTP